MQYLLVALTASIVGALSGIGGGVIIKPLLDLTSDYDISTINLLSCFTVFAMALSSVIKLTHLKTKFEMHITLPLALGAVVGGLLGDTFLSTLVQRAPNSAAIGQIQNTLLMILLIFVLLYINRLKTILHFKVENKIFIILTGMSLGMLSTFIGIGGGPINIVILMLFFSLNTKDASINSLVLILFSQSAKLLRTALTQGFVDFDLSALLFMIPAGIIGGMIGSDLNRKFSTKQILWVFNTILLFIITVTLMNILK